MEEDRFGELRLFRGAIFQVSVVAEGEVLQQHQQLNREGPRPSIWTAKATDILEKVKRAWAARDTRQPAYRATIRYEQENMSLRKEWRKVLDSEVKRWSALPCGQLASELKEVQTYEVEFDSKKYQVEVELLENTEQYLHVMVAVDDGSLPASISPLTHSFIRQKTLPSL